MADGADANGLGSRSGSMSSHVIRPSELASFVDHINTQLAEDPAVAPSLPISPPEQLFEAVKDGVLLAHLINSTVEGTIGPGKINPPPVKSPYQAAENHNATISGARAIGCQITNIGPQDLMDSVGNNTKHLVLGILWQIVKAGLMRKITIEKHPELIRLIRPGENLALFLEMPPEQLLLRWVNYHLKHAGSDRTVTNFSRDIMDSVVYATVLGQIAPKQCVCSLAELEAESDPVRRAGLVLETCDKLDCRKFVSAQDIASGHSRLNLAFVANLFNHHPGIQLPTEEELAMLNQSKEELYNTITHLKGQCEAASLENASLQDRIDAFEAAQAEAELDRARIVEESELLTELTATLEEQVANLQAGAAKTAKDHAQTVDVLQGFLSAVQQEKDTMEAKLKADLEAAQARFLEVEGINEALRREVERLTRELAEMTRLRDMLKDQLEAYVAANERGTKAYDEVLSEKDQAAVRVQHLTTKNEMLQANLAASEKNYTHHLEQQSHQNSELQAALDALREEHQALKEAHEAQTKEKEQLEKKERAMNNMLAHTTSQLMNDRAQIGHLKTLYSAFPNARKLAKILYRGLIMWQCWSRAELEALKGQEAPAMAGALIRPAGDKHKESKPLFYVLKDNFLFGFKIDKWAEPHDVIRLDDAILTRNVTTDGHVIAITPTFAQEEPTYQLQLESEPQADAWFNGLSVAREWWADNKEKRQKAFAVSPHNSAPSLFIHSP